MRSGWREIADPLSTVLRRYFSVARGALLGVALVVFLSSVAAITAPYVFSRLVDAITAQNWLEATLAGFLAYAVLLGISAALQRMTGFLSLMTSQSLSFVVATAFFERLIRKSVTFFVENNPAEIQSAQSRGQWATSSVVQFALNSVIPGTTQIVLALILLGAVVSIEVVVIVALYGVGFVALSYWANLRSRPHLASAMTAMQENSRFAGNAMNAIETLRHFGSSQWMQEQFTQKARNVRDGWGRYSLHHVAYSVLFGLALTVQFAITFVVLLPRVRDGQLSVGDVVLFNLLLLQLNQPFEMIGHAIDEFVHSYERFKPFAQMWAAPEEPDLGGESAFTPVHGRIVFENVGFAYEGGRGVRGISFVAERGNVTYLVGETGSGKSTVFRMALRSIDPQSGKITVDGTDLTAIPRTTWFSRVGVVPQEIMLLNDSLRTNIVLGRPADEARLRRAADKAAILDFIDALPDGFDTQVGERGLRLSGGERQRIAIARALYGDPKILLLDEASSALDEATEKDIMDHIRTLVDEVTVIAITHRRSVIGPHDRQVLLDGGTVRGVQPPGRDER